MFLFPDPYCERFSRENLEEIFSLLEWKVNENKERKENCEMFFCHSIVPIAITTLLKAFFLSRIKLKIDVP